MEEVEETTGLTVQGTDEVLLLHQLIFSLAAIMLRRNNNLVSSVKKSRGEHPDDGARHNRA